MKNTILFLLFLPLFAIGQLLVPNQSQINFGNVMVGQIDSVQISVQNNSSSPIQITGLKFYSIYNHNPFSSSTTSLMVPAQGSVSFYVRFEPEQNILHNSELVIQHNFNTGFEAIDLIGQGKFPNSYYNSTENLSEQALKNALKTRTGQSYQQVSYNVARDNMYGSIDNNGGSVTCVYTGRVATFNSRTGANSNNFNCEHTFPQGFFNQALPMRSDIHHLFPTDVNSNSQRSNLPFGIVNGNGTWSQGGSKKGGGNFEPRDLQKGATARAMMYFVIRYQDYSSHFSSQESILRTWHNTYPPSTGETQRNAAIFNVQNNRNPFVDYPQLEKRISNFVSNSVASSQFGLDILQSSINFRTIPILALDTFDYVLVNRGNQTIQLSNLNFNNGTSYSFAGNSGSNQNLAVGEAIEISIVFNPNSASNFRDTLNFSTNIPGSLSNLSIPINGNGTSVGLVEKDLKNKAQVFPNPVKEILNVHLGLHSGINYQIIDMQGRILKSGTIKQDQRLLKVSTTTYSKGIYLINFIEEGSQFQKAFVVD